MNKIKNPLLVFMISTLTLGLYTPIMLILNLDKIDRKQFYNSFITLCISLVLLGLDTIYRVFPTFLLSIFVAFIVVDLNNKLYNEIVEKKENKISPYLFNKLSILCMLIISVIIILMVIIDFYSNQNFEFFFLTPLPHSSVIFDFTFIGGIIIALASRNAVIQLKIDKCCCEDQENNLIDGSEVSEKNIKKRNPFIVFMLTIFTGGFYTPVFWLNSIKLKKRFEVFAPIKNILIFYLISLLFFCFFMFLYFPILLIFLIVTCYIIILISNVAINNIKLDGKSIKTQLIKINKNFIVAFSIMILFVVLSYYRVMIPEVLIYDGEDCFTMTMIAFGFFLGICLFAIACENAYIQIWLNRIANDNQPITNVSDEVKNQKPIFIFLKTLFSAGVYDIVYVSRLLKNKKFGLKISHIALVLYMLYVYRIKALLDWDIFNQQGYPPAPYYLFNHVLTIPIDKDIMTIIVVVFVLITTILFAIITYNSERNNSTIMAIVHISNLAIIGIDIFGSLELPRYYLVLLFLYLLIISTRNYFIQKRIRNE